MTKIITIPIFIAVFTGLLMHKAKAEIIPYYKVIHHISIEIPTVVTSRLYLPGTTTTTVIVRTITGAIKYNVNGEDPTKTGGFSLRPMEAIQLSAQQAEAFRCVNTETRPHRIEVSFLDIYPFGQ